jgi:hypothetical protein
MDLFFQHPVLWWQGLVGADRLALVAVAIGALTVVVTTFIGLHRWWRRWKQERTPDEI